MKNKIRKTAVLLLIFVMTIVTFIFINSLFLQKKKLTTSNKPKYLCENSLANCSQVNPPGVPKGVCIPGEKCT